MLPPDSSATAGAPPQEPQKMVASKTAHPVTVLVVDDHGIVREGLTVLLERDPHIRVVGGAATGTEAVASARKLKPNVVVMDLVLPELDGIDATRQILDRDPQTRILVLSVCCTAEHVFRALRAGASGYLLKQSAAAELVHAVAAVLRGERYISPLVTQRLNGLTIEAAELSPLERLSPRERHVLQLVVAGATSAQIALKLSLSPKTVETYRSRLMDKLGLADHRSLIRFAVEHSLAPA